MKTIHFIAGLPRSGSTLLANVLAQNPHFHLGGTSGLVDVLLSLRNGWGRQEEHRAMPPGACEAAKLRVMAAAMGAYHPDREGVTFDRGRAWLAHLEMAELVLGREVKVLVPVRDVRDVLASLEVLWRDCSATRQMPYEAKNYFAFQSAAGRCAAHAAQDGILGIAYARVLDAFTRGLGDRLHLVRYEELTLRPRSTLRAAYEFLGEPWHEHDFGLVRQTIYEDDGAYGMPGLHDFRPQVEPRPSRWREALGDAASPYGAFNAALGYPPDLGG